MIRQYLALAWVAAGTLLAWHPGSAQATSAPSTAGNDGQPAWVGETGTASYYGQAHHGRRTASGTRFDQDALTAAHPWLPFGTRVRVTLHGSDRVVTVVITDRLYSTRRIIDLSLGAARHLGILQQGLARVSLVPT